MYLNPKYAVEDPPTILETFAVVISELVVEAFTARPE